MAKVKFDNHAARRIRNTLPMNLGFECTNIMRALEEFTEKLPSKNIFLITNNLFPSDADPGFYGKDLYIKERIPLLVLFGYVVTWTWQERVKIEIIIRDGKKILYVETRPEDADDVFVLVTDWLRSAQSTISEISLNNKTVKIKF